MEISQEINQNDLNAKELDGVIVISKVQIPAITEVTHNGNVEQLGELRDFRWHDALKQFLPSENIISFSWTKLETGEVLNPHKHSTASMIIICRGKGKLSGDIQKNIEEGDIVAVPKGCAHGFEGVEGGFTALSIQFGSGLYTDPQNPRVSFLDKNSSLESLLKLNEQHLEQFRSSRFITLLTDGTLKNNMRKRQRYVEALQIWSDKNQDLLFARQATTTMDTKFSAMFLEHMFEEVGHDRMHADRQEQFDESQALKEDPIIEAIASWFICQMFRRDAIVKTALIHLIIENASHFYHTVARPLLATTINDEYFKEHEADTRHAEMGLTLLRHLSDEQYRELHRMVEKGWAMLMSMANRVCELVDQID